MNRKHRVVAAGAISTLLVVGSAALAFVNGALASTPVDQVGSFHAIEAQLAAATEGSSTTVGPDVSASGTGAPAWSGATTGAPTAPTATVVPSSTGVPTGSPTNEQLHESGGRPADEVSEPHTTVKSLPDASLSSESREREEHEGEAPEGLEPDD